MNQMDYFFNPKSIAVIGASRHPRKIGHVVFRNFIESGYKGKIFPVNPNAETMFGMKSYKSVKDIKENVELAVIVIPAKFVVQAVEECGKKRVPAVIIISSGFKEVGNVELENQLIRTLKKYKIRAIGVNGLGVFDAHTGIDTFFLPRYKLERPDKGNISFISQSGATGSVIMDWMAMKGYKIAKFISYGNATDIDEADLTEYLANDKKTNVICAYFEGVKEGRKFYETTRKISGKKPIIVLKGGTTTEGTAAVASHTGSLAGAAEVYSAAFKQAGVVQAEGLEEIFDYARTLSTQPKPKGNRVQIITDGGGFGVLTSDWLIKYGLKLAKMEEKTINELKKIFPSYVSFKNPMDLTGDADTPRYREAVNAAMDDPNVDIVVVIVLFQVPALTPDVVDVISEAAERKTKPLIVISSGGRYTEVLKKSLEDFGVPTFSYPRGAAKALRVLVEYGKR
ncbi:MAG: CoA-binding protein [Nanoarchaeota archaeon]|nr:CoA-binding protein [Nanoarchaeota archaeon]